MAISDDELRTLIAQEDLEGIYKLFEGTSEEERRAIAPLAMAEYDRVSSKQWNEIINDVKKPCDTSVVEAAALATASYSELKSQEFGPLRTPEIAVAVLRDRRPSWIQRFVEHITEADVYFNTWLVVHSLALEGLCRPPASDSYVLSMIWCVSRGHDDDRTLYETLRGMPDVLERDLWRLFEVEGSGENSLAAYDKYTLPELQWSVALVKLAQSGDVPRMRLLEASLEALARDFAQFRAGWFSRLHESLKPTKTERASFVPRYLELLSSRIPPTVSFALKQLEVAQKEGSLSANELVASAEPALQAAAKGTVKKTLRMLGRAVKSEPGLTTHAVEAAALALGHTAPDVQEAALKLLAKWAPEGCPNGLRDHLAPFIEAVAASIKESASAWYGASDTTEGTSAEKEPPPSLDIEALMLEAKQLATGDDPADLNRVLSSVEKQELPPALSDFNVPWPVLIDERRIEPIAELDELIDVWAAIIEGADDVVQIERAIDGASRLCDVEPDDFEQRTGPLRSRARKIFEREWEYEPFSGANIQCDFCSLVICWLERKTYRPVTVGESSHPACWIHYQRMAQVARRAAGRKARVTVCLPTHEPCLVEPLAFVERILASPPVWKLDFADVVLGLLRLAQPGRAQALEAAAQVPGEIGAATRYALGSTGEAVGPTRELWYAAARARVPHGDALEVEKRHPHGGPDAAMVARYMLRPHVRESGGYKFFSLKEDVTPSLPNRARQDCPTTALHMSSNQNGFGEYGWTPSPVEVKWLASLWPGNYDAYFSLGARALAYNLDWHQASWGHAAYMEPLLEPDVPLGHNGRALLVLGLSAKSPGERSLATDALIATIEDGRLDARALGAAMKEYVFSVLSRADRLAGCLRDAAQSSPLHKHVIREAIEESLQGEPDQRPRAVDKLFQVLLDLSVECKTGVISEKTRDYLASLKGSSKATKVGKRLIKLETGQNIPHLTVEAVGSALIARVERAHRWKP